MVRSDSMDFLKIEKHGPTLSEWTTQTLRKAILALHFEPGQRLVERELCEQTGVSRTCIREALRHLESEGLVERVPNKGIFVASLSLDETRQIYEVREALEAAAGRQFALRADDKDIIDLKTALRQLEGAVETPDDHGAYVAALDHLYDVLLRGSRNEIAAQLLRTLRARINYLRAMTARREPAARRRETVCLAGAIVGAAGARDPDRTADFCAAFVRRSAEFALEVLRGNEAAAGAGR